MNAQAHGALAQFSNVCEELAQHMPNNLALAQERLPANASDHDRGFLEGYCAGQAKALTDMADDIRQMLSADPPRAERRSSWFFLFWSTS
jgi:hypothetical protein